MIPGRASGSQERMTAVTRVWLMEKRLNLPRAVREQAERAEAAHLALLGNTGTPAPTEPVTPPAPTPTEPPPTPEVPVVPAPVVIEPTPVEPAADTWELRYRVLNGKYTSEVPRLAAELRELKEQLRTATSTPAPAATEIDTTGLTPETVVAQYGEDFASAVDAIAEARTKKLRDKVEAIEGETAKRSRSDFIRDLSTYVSNWQAIDQDPGFTAFLDEFDPLTGRVRREFFNEADQQNDAARIASFFTSFSRAKKPAPTPPVVVTPPAPPVALPSVEPLIVPDSSRRSEAPPGKKLWTQSEIGKFYRDSRAQGGSKPYGLYTAKEFDAIDRDVSAAVQEGRVIAG